MLCHFVSTRHIVAVFGYTVTASLPQPINFRTEKRSQRPGNRTLSEPVTLSLLSSLCILMQILVHATGDYGCGARGGGGGGEGGGKKERGI